MVHNQPHDPATIWQTALGELQLQLPRETFNTWLRGARFLSHEGGRYTIGVENVYAREWLDQRLRKAITRTLGQVARQPVEVEFVLFKPPHPAAEPAGAGPLLPRQEEPRPTPFYEPLPYAETRLNPGMTFEAFALGSCNRMAHAAALAIVEAPATQFNPLVIQAGVGLGKSHLLHAVGNALAAQGLQVLYTSAETFTNELIGAIQSHRTADFRERYRSLDVLLVDDAQFLAGKESSQEEFFHTFEALYHAGGQVVLALNRAPSAVPKLDPRLRSRFEGGLVVELDAPDYLTRLDILDIRLRQRGFTDRVPDQVLEALAEQVSGSMRDLEGALNRLLAAMLVSHGAPAAHLLESVVSPGEVTPAILTLQDIVLAVTDYYGLAPEAIAGRDRSRDVSIARQVVMYLARIELDLSLPQIGSELGGRNHSTVLYSCERVAEMVRANTHLRQQVLAITDSLRRARSAEPVRQVLR